MSRTALSTSTAATSAGDACAHTSFPYWRFS